MDTLARIVTETFAARQGITPAFAIGRTRSCLLVVQARR